mmetsp:Transcript_52013/g.103297  ORF Transcript_52013/g.103297 Transcript_52013/m.103297 type:complete len:298 (-) Transcript_52013:472-1365(-)
MLTFFPLRWQRRGRRRLVFLSGRCCLLLLLSLLLSRGVGVALRHPFFGVRLHVEAQWERAAVVDLHRLESGEVQCEALQVQHQHVGQLRHAGPPHAAQLVRDPCLVLELDLVVPVHHLVLHQLGQPVLHRLDAPRDLQLELHQRVALLARFEPRRLLFRDALVHHLEPEALLVRRERLLVRLQGGLQLLHELVVELGGVVLLEHVVLKCHAGARLHQRPRVERALLGPRQVQKRALHLLQHARRLLQWGGVGQGERGGGRATVHHDPPRRRRVAACLASFKQVVAQFATRKGPPFLG